MAAKPVQQHALHQLGGLNRAWVAVRRALEHELACAGFLELGLHFGELGIQRLHLFGEHARLVVEGDREDVVGLLVRVQRLFTRLKVAVQRIELVAQPVACRTRVFECAFEVLIDEVVDHRREESLRSVGVRILQFNGGESAVTHRQHFEAAPELVGRALRRDLVGHRLWHGSGRQVLEEGGIIVEA